MRTFNKAALAWTAMIAFCGAAIAGEQYVDETGYALSGYDPVAYFSLTQSPVGEKQPAAIPGKAAITAEWNGARWAFASAENKARFLADPARYAPQYDGHCAYGVAKGGKVPANPNLWRIVDGKLYLNISPNVAGLWEEDIAGNISSADGNWRSAEAEPASSTSWTAIDANKGTYSAIAPIAE